MVRRLNVELNKIILDAKFSECVLTPWAAEPNGGTTEGFAAFLKADTESAAKPVQIAYGTRGCAPTG